MDGVENIRKISKADIEASNNAFYETWNDRAEYVTIIRSGRV